MASSFGATTIRVERDNGGALPLPQRPTYGSTRHVPGGGDITQVTGYGAPVVTYTLWLTDAEYAALVAQLQTTAVLTLAGVAQGTWLLEDIGAGISEIGGYVQVPATFRSAT